MATFYHVQSAEDDIVLRFVPKVPSNRLLREEGETPRICLSKTIQGALKGAQLFYGKSDDNSSCFRNGLNGRYIRVYSFKNLESEFLVTDVELTTNGYVDDAMFTSEHWYFKAVEPDEVFLIFVLTPSVVMGSQFYEEVYQFEIISDELKRSVLV